MKMENMRAVIIDDEVRARRLLRVMLEESCPQVTVVGDAENLPEGTILIRKMKPDIVFLDIEMPGYSGIRLLDFLGPDETDFELIFTTAYSEFAVKAFQLNAIDYLLKPLQEDKLIAAVEKAEKFRGRSKMQQQLEELQVSMEASGPRKVALPLAEGILFIDLKEVILMQAERMYTVVFTEKEGKTLVSKPLRYFLDMLEGVPGFFQPHRSYFINLDRVKQYSARDGGYILMDNGETVAISRNKKEEFQRLLSL
jgi:two-component system LytT family response regulator